MNLGPAVNSVYEDGAPTLAFDGATLSRDGTQLYFFSNRLLGGFGHNDLYVATRTKLRD